MEEPQVVGTFPLPANEQPAKAVVPCVGPLDDPSSRSSASAPSMLLATSTNVWPDAARSDLALDVVEVVALVEAKIFRSSRSTCRSHDDRVDGRYSGPLVVDIGGRDLRCQWHASAIGHDVTFDA